MASENDKTKSFGILFSFRVNFPFGRVRIFFFFSVMRNCISTSVRRENNRIMGFLKNAKKNDDFTLELCWINGGKINEFSMNDSGFWGALQKWWWILSNEKLIWLFLFGIRFLYWKFDDQWMKWNLLFPT